MLKTFKKYSFILLTTLVLLSSFFTTAPKINAQTCRYIGQCVNNIKCICPPDERVSNCRADTSLIIPGESECGSAVIGGVEPPLAIQNLNDVSGGEIGVVFFISRLLTFAGVLGGILVMVNFVIAGFTYVTMAGNTAAHQKVRERITWSIVGILIIISAYSIAGIIGLLFFGDASFIINPQLVGAV